MVGVKDLVKDHTSKYQGLDWNLGRLALHCLPALPLDEHRVFGEPVKSSEAAACGSYA